MKSNEDNKTRISNILVRNIFLCLKQVYCCLTFVCVYIWLFWGVILCLLPTYDVFITLVNLYYLHAILIYTKWWYCPDVCHSFFQIEFDRPKSVCNRCVIEVFDGVFVLSIGFWIFCWYRGFCHRTESDLLLFSLVIILISSITKYTERVMHKNVYPDWMHNQMGIRIRIFRCTLNAALLQNITTIYL